MACLILECINAGTEGICKKKNCICFYIPEFCLICLPETSA